MVIDRNVRVDREAFDELFTVPRYGSLEVSGRRAFVVQFLYTDESATFGDRDVFYIDDPEGGG